MKTKVKVNRAISKNIYIHNDLDNVAFYLLNKIQKRIDAKEEEGISLEIMSCLVMLAFSFEAKINFIGQLKIKKWRELDPYKTKIKKIRKYFSDYTAARSTHYQNMITLKKYRDTIAHGKPYLTRSENVITLGVDELDNLLDLDNGVYDLCTMAFLSKCSESIDVIWKGWLSLGNIEPNDTITHGHASTTFIDR